MDEAWRAIASLTRQAEETKKQLAHTDKLVGEMTNGWGKFVEALVIPAIPICFGKLGYRVYEDGPRQSHRDDDTLQIDDLALARHEDGREVAIVVEVKSHMDRPAVDELLADLPRVFEFFSYLRGRDAIGVAAGIRVDQGVARYAQERGLYALVPSGETVRLANPKRFEPRVFRSR